MNIVKPTCSFNCLTDSLSPLSLSFRMQKSIIIVTINREKKGGMEVGITFELIKVIMELQILEIPLNIVKQLLVTIVISPIGVPCNQSRRSKSGLIIIS